MNYENKEKKTIGVKEFAEMYGLGINNAYVIVNSSTFPKIRVGRKIIVINSKIDRWLEENIGESF